MASTRGVIVAVAATAALGFTAGRTLAAQQTGALPPVRQMDRRLAVAADTFGNITGIRQLSDGRVIVNDIGKRRLVILDSNLKHAIVIADSTASTQKAYGRTPGGLIAYRGDTTLFVDPSALSLLVVDARGAIVRTIAPPRPADAPALASSMSGVAADAAGRIVYRYVSMLCTGSACALEIPRHPLDSATLKGSALPVWALHDSVAILRGTTTTQRIDTAGFIATPFTGNSRMGANPDGSATFRVTSPSPIPLADGWGVVSDGSIAFVRGMDYHIDWIAPDGSRTSTPKIAHEWHRMSDSEKSWILDSAKQFSDSVNHLVAAQQAKRDSANHVNARSTTVNVVVSWPNPADLPDYRPVLTPYAIVKGDADDNLWIQQGGAPSSPAGRGSPLRFDVVNRNGVLVDRVQLPPTLGLAGFGPGVMYMTSREGYGTLLLKYRIR